MKKVIIISMIVIFLLIIIVFGINYYVASSTMDQIIKEEDYSKLKVSKFKNEG